MFSVFDRALQRSVISRELTRDHLHAMFGAQACGAQSKQQQEWRPTWAHDNTAGETIAMLKMYVARRDL